MGDPNDSREPEEPSDPQGSEEEDLTEIEAARDAVFDALLQLEDVWHRRGWDAGFDEGWKGALKHVTETFRRRRNFESPSPPPPPSGERSPRAKPKRTANDVVLDLIRDDPGARGVELVARSSRSSTPLKERTIRTALHRLKVAGAIRNLNGRWYLSDGSPNDSQSQQSTKDKEQSSD